VLLASVCVVEDHISSSYCYCCSAVSICYCACIDRLHKRYDDLYQMQTNNRDMREIAAAGASQPIAGLQHLAQAPFLSATVNPARPSTLLVYNHDALCHIDLDTAVPTQATMHRTAAAQVAVAPSTSTSSSGSSSTKAHSKSKSKSKDRKASYSASDNGKKRKRERAEVFTDVATDVAAVAATPVAAAAAAVPAAAAAAAVAATDDTEDTDEAVTAVEAAAAAPVVVQNGNFTLCLRFRPVLHVDFLGPNEMVIVECPWSKIVASLPDTLYRQRYGT
jgi:hypothetical protein